MPKDLLANATAAFATSLENGDVQPLLDELHSLLHNNTTTTNNFKQHHKDLVSSFCPRPYQSPPWRHPS
tara:strand:+ start:1109 stop:1315 length:207 start_codon:yes stop_codon:yes gene_type:complete